ncbi:MAG: tetratricopeptide repeat protein, partial [Cyanobacteriota bacterium]
MICPECKNKIKDKIITCPHCGRNINDENNSNKAKNLSRNRLIILFFTILFPLIICLSGIITVGGIIGYFYYKSDSYIISKYENQVKAKPDYVKAHLKLAEVYKSRYMYYQAIEQYKSVIKLDPGDYKAYEGLGICYFLIDKYSEAIEVLEKSVKINDKAFDSQYYLGKSYVRIDEYKKALKQYNIAVKIKPDDEKLNNSIGYAYEHINDLAAAIEFYEKAIKLNREFSPPYSNLARVYSTKQMYDKALYNAKKAIALEESCYNHYILGYVYEKTDDIDNAISYYKKVIKCAPSQNYGTYNR